MWKLLHVALVWGLLATPAQAASSDTYKWLDLFGDVYDKIEASYVREPSGRALIKAAIEGMVQTQPTGAAATFARQKAAGLPGGKTALLDAFGDVFEKYRSSGSRAPSDADLTTAALKNMLASLDPHSSFIDAKTFQDMQAQTRGEFGGVGIEVTLHDGVVQVVSPIDGTPAARAGLQSGDLITHIDGRSLRGLTLADCVGLMRGKVGTSLRLTVARPGRGSSSEVTVVREIVRIVPVTSRVEGSVGYIRISSFNEKTVDAFRSAVQSLRSDIGSEIKGFIIDLRNNPGGLLDQAAKVSDELLESGAIIVTQGRRAADGARINARRATFPKASSLWSSSMAAQRPPPRFSPVACKIIGALPCLEQNRSARGRSRRSYRWARKAP